MRANLRTLRKPRRFSNEFKHTVVKEYEGGSLSVCQLGRLYGIAPQNIYRWIYKFSTFNKKGVRIVEMKASRSQKMKELEEKVKELERLVGQKQIKIDYLEKMMDMAQQHYNIDIKKNYNTSQSAGSAKTNKK